MKTIQVGELKNKLSQVIERVKHGEKIVVSYGKRKENVAVIVPYSEYNRAVLLDGRSAKYASKVSYWEIALKYQRGKLQLKGITPEALMEAASQAGYEIFDISEDDLISSYRLPASAVHRDPFDRLSVWQCIRDDPRS